MSRNLPKGLCDVDLFVPNLDFVFGEASSANMLTETDRKGSHFCQRCGDQLHLSATRERRVFKVG